MDHLILLSDILSVKIVNLITWLRTCGYETVMRSSCVGDCMKVYFFNTFIACKYQTAKYMSFNFLLPFGSPNR
uniref:Uncharacterized protein n=1 Tax=Oryza brachyantha TaxID=4533 RepID=J3L2G3_ORYBR